MKERLNYIDYMKTAGIYLIILGHMFPEPGTNFIYSFSVPLFFFISGFLFSAKGIPFSQFLIKNIKALIIPYLFINGICLMSIISFSENISLDDSLIKPLLGVLIGANQGKMSVCAVTRPTWFIYTLFLLRIGMYFIVSIRKKYVLTIVTLCITLACLLNRMYLPNLAVFNCFCMAPIFILGYYTKSSINKIDRIANVGKRFLHIILAFVVLCFLSPYNGYVMCYAHGYGNNIILFYVNSLIGIYMLYQISAYLNNVRCRCNLIISQGTILILGFHYLLIILFNKIYHTNDLMITMMYAFLILIAFIPIIKFALIKFPWIVGKNK